MSACYVTAMLPFLDPTIPDVRKPRSTLSTTTLWLSEDEEIEASISSYSATGPPAANSAAIVVAKISADGASPPELEAISISPCAGQPSDPDYNDHLPDPFRPIVTTLGIVERVNITDRQFTIVGTDFLVSFYYFLYLNLYIFTNLFLLSVANIGPSELSATSHRVESPRTSAYQRLDVW